MANAAFSRFLRFETLLHAGGLKVSTVETMVHAGGLKVSTVETMLHAGSKLLRQVANDLAEGSYVHEVRTKLQISPPDSQRREKQMTNDKNDSDHATAGITGTFYFEFHRCLSVKGRR